MASYRKIGLIAGAGALPHAVLEAARSQGCEAYIAALTGFSATSDFDAPDASQAGQYRLGEVGRLIKTLKAQNVDAITFAGIVSRPDFSALRPDMAAMKYLPGVIKAAAKGDDALLTHVTGIFEKEGMTVIGPQEICSALMAPLGPLGSVAPTTEHQVDIEKARYIAKAIGALDIGQGAIVRDGLVLAVEAQDGTDGMLARAALLPADIRGEAGARGGVLAKMVKPGQEERIDLPTIGLKTIEGAIAAGLSGIAVEQGAAFIMDRQKLIAAADAAGLFVTGLERTPYTRDDYDG